MSNQIKKNFSLNKYLPTNFLISLIVLSSIIGHCLSGLFGRCLGPFGASIITTSCLFLFFFASLFLVGSPYLSMIIMLSCFIFYNWYYTMPVINSIFFLSFNIFIIIILIFVQTNVLIIILFAIQLLFYLLVITAVVSLYNNTFLKKSFILLGFYVLLLGIYLSILKIYFLNVIGILALAPESSILFQNIPSKIFLSFKNLYFFKQNPLVILDFANDNQLSDLIIQFSKFDETNRLFFYMTQMIILNNYSHLNLVFIII